MKNTATLAGLGLGTLEDDLGSRRCLTRCTRARRCSLNQPSRPLGSLAACSPRERAGLAGSSELRRSLAKHRNVPGPRRNRDHSTDRRRPHHRSLSTDRARAPRSGSGNHPTSSAAMPVTAPSAKARSPEGSKALADTPPSDSWFRDEAEAPPFIQAETTRTCRHRRRSDRPTPSLGPVSAVSVPVLSGRGLHDFTELVAGAARDPRGRAAVPPEQDVQQGSLGPVSPAHPSSGSAVRWPAG